MNGARASDPIVIDMTSEAHADHAGMVTVFIRPRHQSSTASPMEKRLDRHSTRSASEQLGPEFHGWNLMSMDNLMLRDDEDEWKLHDYIWAVEPHDASTSASLRRRSSTVARGSGDVIDLNDAIPNAHIDVQCHVHFNMIRDGIGPEFNVNQGSKELVDNAIQSVTLQSLHQPLKQNAPGWTPQIEIYLDERNRTYGVIDNGHGFTQRSLKQWAHHGHSKNKLDLESIRGGGLGHRRADRNFLSGYFSSQFSYNGVGEKGACIIMTEDKDKVVHGTIEIRSKREKGSMVLVLPMDMSRMQREEDAERNPWNQRISTEAPSADVSTQCAKPGWGDRYTRVEIKHLTPTAIARLKETLVADICETYPYVLWPDLIKDLNLDATYHPPPKKVRMTVRIVAADGTESVYDLNEQVIDGMNAVASVSAARDIVRLGNKVKPFQSELPVRAASGASKTAYLDLWYFPLTSGSETLPEDVTAGIDIMWQGRWLSLDPLRLLPFMRTGQNRGNDSFWRSQRGRRLNGKLERCIKRVHGRLLLPHSFAVAKNKSQLIRNPERPDAATQLVNALVNLELDEQISAIVDRFSLWLDAAMQADDAFVFIFEGGEVMAYKPAHPGGVAPAGYYTKRMRYSGEDFVAPMTGHERPLRVKIRRDRNKSDKDKGNLIWAEVFGFRFTHENGLSIEEQRAVCTGATDGEVIFREWKDEAFQHDDVMPLANMVKHKVTDDEWRKQIDKFRRDRDGAQPREICLLTSHESQSVLNPDEAIPIPLEAACQGRDCPFEWIAVQVKKGKARDRQRVVMPYRELEPYEIVISAQHEASDEDPELGVYAGSDFNSDASGATLWLRPLKLDRPGTWLITLTLKHRVPQGGASASASPLVVESCARFQFKLTVANAARAAAIKIVTDAGDERSDVRLGDMLPVRVHATDCVGLPFELPLPTEAAGAAAEAADAEACGYTLTLVDAAESRAEGVVLEGEATWEYGETEDESGVRPIVLRGMHLRGKLPRRRKLTLCLEASGPQAPAPTRASSVKFNLTAAQGQPHHLRLTYNGDATPHVPVDIAQIAPHDAHVHIEGGKLTAGERLGKMVLGVYDQDDNLTRSNVSVMQAAPAGEACLSYNHDSLNDAYVEVVPDARAEELVLHGRHHHFAAKDVDDLEESHDDVELTFVAFHGELDDADLDEMPRASVHFQLEKPEVSDDDDLPPVALAIAVVDGISGDGLSSESAVRAGVPFQILVKAYDENGDETSVPEGLQPTLVFTPSSVSHHFGAAWQRLDDGEDPATILKTVTLTCAESDVNISLGDDLAGLACEAIDLHVARGVATRILVEGSAQACGVDNGCKLDRALTVALLDGFNDQIPTDQKPANTPANVRWAIVPADPAACEVKLLHETSQTNASLQVQVVTAAVLRDNANVGVIVRYGALEKEVPLCVRPGPVPRRLVIHLVDPATAGELDVDDATGEYVLRGLVAGGGALPGLGVRVELENGQFLGHGVKLTACLDDDNMTQMRNTCQLPGSGERARRVDGLVIPKRTTPPHVLRLRVDTTNGLDKEDKTKCELLSKIVPRGAGATCDGPRIFLERKVRLPLEAAAPSKLRLRTDVNDDGNDEFVKKFTSGRGWGPHAATSGPPALLLTDDNENAISGDAAPDLRLAVTLEPPRARGATAASSAAVPPPAMREPAALVADAVASPTIMRGGHLAWAELEPRLRLTDGGRTGTYTMRIAGHDIAATTASAPLVTGEFTFSYIDPEQMGEEEKERAEIKAQLPQQEKEEKEARNRLRKAEKALADAKKAADASGDAESRRQREDEEAERAMRERQHRCNEATLRAAYDPGSEAALAPASQGIVDALSRASMTIPFNNGDTVEHLAPEELNGRVVDDGSARMVVVRPVGDDERIVGIFMRGSDGTEERRGDREYTMPSRDEQALKEGLHRQGTLVRTGGVTDGRIGEAILALLGGDVALVGLGARAAEADQTDVATAALRVVRHVHNAAPLMCDGAILPDDVTLTQSGLLAIGGDVLPPQPSADAGDASYLVNAIYLEDGDEQIRKALYSQLGRTVVLLSESATSAHLDEYFLAHRRDPRIDAAVIRLGGRGSHEPFDAYIRGAFQRRPRLPAAQTGAFRRLSLDELAEPGAFSEGGAVVDPRHDLTQILEATPIGTDGLELLRARACKADKEAALEAKRAESSALREQQAEAQTECDAAKASHADAKMKHEGLKARLQELERGDDDDDDDGAAANVNARRTRPRLA